MNIKQTPSFYTQDQLELYLAHIGYSGAAKLELNESATPLDRLRLLTRLHIVAFPWSNTEMHYTKDHYVEVSPEGVFNLLIRGGKKGTYCFGHNTLFLGMLRRMGYRVYPVSARTVIGVPRSPPTRLTHMALIVQPFGESRPLETYVVDVGFGSSSLCDPILLSDDPSNTVMGTTKSEKHRLQRVILPDSVVTDRPLWELQLWRSSNSPDEWVGLYVFSEEESFLCDFSAASYFVCNIPNQIGRMQNNIMITRSYFLDPAKPKSGGEMGKYLLLDGMLKRTEGEKSEVVKVFTSEEERIETIWEVFGIELGNDAEEVIRSRTPALKIEWVN